MHLQLDHNSAVPLHQQAEEWLRQLIRNEVYRNGHPLPPEVDLARQLHISRNTLRQAISRLVFEGLLIRKRRQGTCVSDGSRLPAPGPFISGTLIAPGVHPESLELHVGYCPPSEAARMLFKIPDEKKVLRLERLNGTTAIPFEYMVVEFNPVLPVSASENFHCSISVILEKVYQLPIKRTEEIIQAAVADAALSVKLDVEPGTPLLLLKRCIYIANEIPAVLSTGYYKADAFAYSIEHRYG